MPLYKSNRTGYKNSNSQSIGSPKEPNNGELYSDKLIEVKNARPSDSNEALIQTALQNASTEKIIGSNLDPLVNYNLYPVPIFLGKPGEPTVEYLYHDPELSQVNPSLFLTEQGGYCPPYFFSSDTGCYEYFLFANIQTKKSIDRGVIAENSKTNFSAPYPYLDKTIEYNTGNTQVLFVTQKEKEIEIKAFQLQVINMGKGIPVVSENPIEIDTWYNGEWEKYNIGKNVGGGYTNYNYQVGDRYNWSFGTIYITKSFGSMTDEPITPSSGFGLREIGYEYKEKNIKLVGWSYSVNKSNIIKETTQMPLDEKKVYGRQIYTFLIKSLEEGKCIRITEDNGAIIISVDLHYNGNCCKLE